MKIDELRSGMAVKDTWFSYHNGLYSEPWGEGIVAHVTKTKVVVKFECEGNVVYDEEHLRYLEKNVGTS